MLLASYLNLKFLTNLSQAEFFQKVSPIYKGRSHDPGNRAGPLSGINFSCVHMVVFIPPTGMKFNIDWYVYLKVWKINYVIPSTHAHFNIFHPSRRDGLFIWENSSPLAEISLSGPVRLPGSYEQALSMMTDLDLQGVFSHTLLTFIFVNGSSYRE